MKEIKKLLKAFGIKNTDDIYSADMEVVDNKIKVSFVKTVYEKKETELKVHEYMLISKKEYEKLKSK